MRTAIFLGLIAIADAIRANWFSADPEKVRFFAILIIVIMMMDIVEFIKNMAKKN